MQPLWHQAEAPIISLDSMRGGAQACVHELRGSVTLQMWTLLLVQSELAASLLQPLCACVAPGRQVRTA